jgi:hypothetical protein
VFFAVQRSNAVYLLLSFRCLCCLSICFPRALGVAPGSQVCAAGVLQGTLQAAVQSQGQLQRRLRRGAAQEQVAEGRRNRRRGRRRGRRRCFRASGGQGRVVQLRAAKPLVVARAVGDTIKPIYSTASLHVRFFNFACLALYGARLSLEVVQDTLAHNLRRRTCQTQQLRERRATRRKAKQNCEACAAAA